MSNCLSKEMEDVTETKDVAVNIVPHKVGCGKCEKAYSSKKSLWRHKRQKRSKMEEVKTSESMKERGVLSPVDFHQNEMTEEEIKEIMRMITEDEIYIPTVIDTETVYRLGEDCYFRQNQTTPYALLHMKKNKLKVNYNELKEIVELLDTISEKVQEYISGKKVAYQQKLKSSTMHVSFNTPYCCVDFRKFWLIPGTEQLAVGKTGVMFTFTEFEQLKNLLIYPSQNNGLECQFTRPMMATRV